MSGSITYYTGTTVAPNTAGTTGQVLVSQGTSAPIFQTSGFQPFAVSTIVAATPYTAAVGTDYFIPVDTSALAITIELPDAPATGQVFIVKDATGNALVNNITVTTVSGIDLIDGATTFPIMVNYRAVQFIFNGTQYYSF